VNARIPALLGLVRGLPAATYHADPDSVSNGMLTAMNDSPAHCHALYLDPQRPARESTDAQTLGTLAHTFILEPDTVATRYAFKPRGMNFATKEGKAWRDEQTREIVSQDNADAAGAMVAAVKRVRVLSDLLASGEAETSVFSIDPVTGLRRRTRPDWLHWTGKDRCVALDIKTIHELTPDAVQRAIGTYAYHRQAAHYTAALQENGIDVEAFVFGFVSSTYPYIACAYVLDDETAAQGRDEVAELMDRFATCKREGFWPALGDGYQLTGLPTWAKRGSEVEVEIVQ
jgi:hypothetical protein